MKRPCSTWGTSVGSSLCHRWCKSSLTITERKDLGKESEQDVVQVRCLLKGGVDPEGRCELLGRLPSEPIFFK